MDRRFAEVQETIKDFKADMNRELAAVRADTKALRADMDKKFKELQETIKVLRVELQLEIRDARAETRDVRVDMNKEFSGIRTTIENLNQNHVDHLAHHNKPKEDTLQ